VVRVTEQIAAQAVLGGALLGGGGGGSLAEGQAFAAEARARGFSQLLDIAELPGEATVVTVSLVGAPAAPDQCVNPEHFVRAVELLRDECRINVHALITSENGGFATVNGWYQSAMLGIPVVDAPCNGRAHPLGLMGSMGLHRRRDYRAHAAVAGGNRRSGRSVEAVFSGSVREVAARVRQAAVEAGGMVAVARHPVPASYVRQHAAVGAISYAIRAGEILAAEAGGPRGLQALHDLGAELVAMGRVTEVQSSTAQGFDVGKVIVTSRGSDYELSFWNEYMTLELDGRRLATFPDLIATVGLDDRLPLTTATVAPGDEIAIVTIPWRALILGAGMRDPNLHAEVEKAIGKEILPLPKDLFVEER